MKKVLFALIFLTVVTVKAQRGVERFGGIILDTLTTTQLLNLPSIAKVKGAYYHDVTKGKLVTWDGSAFKNVSEEIANNITVADVSENFGSSNLETILSEIANKTFIDPSGFNGLLSPTIDTAQELAGVVDNIDGTDDQTATEVPFTPYGDNPHTTVQAAMNWLIDRDGSGVSWDTDPVGGSNFLIKNVAGTVAKTSISTGPNGDYLSGARGIGLTPNDTPDSSVKGWTYMDDSESKMKVSDGSGFKNIPYEEDVLLKNSINTITGVTNITNANGAGLQINGGLENIGLNAGSLAGGSRVSLYMEANRATLSGYSDSEIDATGNTSLTTRGYLLNRIALTDVPTGGTTGQVLAKNSNSDNDVGWVNQTGGSYPSTANQVYVSYHTSKVTVHDSIFAAASLYDGRELNFTTSDTLELGNGVTSAHYNEWINFRALDLDGTGADSIMVRPIDNNKILMNGNALPTNAGNNYIVLPNEYGSIKKLNDSIWDVSIIDKYEGVPVAEIPPALYTISDAVNPNNEANNALGVIGESTGGSYTWASSSEQAYNGTYSIRVDRNLDTGFPMMYHQLTGITSGDNVTVTVWVYRPNDGMGSNVQVRLDDDGEFVTESLVNVNYLGDGVWTEVTVTAVAAKDNPRMELGHTAQNQNAYFYYDSIVITVTP
jgi:hypothetical protein